MSELQKLGLRNRQAGLRVPRIFNPGGIRFCNEPGSSMADKSQTAERAHTTLVLCAAAENLMDAISRESKDPATQRMAEVIVKKLKAEQQRQLRRYEAAKSKP